MPNRISIPKTITEDQLPLQVGTDVSVDHYNKYFTRRHSQYKIERRDNGDVFVIEMASAVHEQAVTFIIFSFGAAIPNPLAVDSPILVSGQPTHFDPRQNGTKVATDITVMPRNTLVQAPVIPYPGPPPGDTRGHIHARVIFEIAVSQSTGSLQNKCIQWLRQPYIRYVIGIKLYRPRLARIGGVGTPHHQTMIATVWRQPEAPSTRPPAAGAAPPAAVPMAVGSPVVPVAGAAPPYLIDRWDFGTRRNDSNAPTGCNAAGNAAFIMRIPTSEIFWDPPIPPAAGYVAAPPPGLGIVATVDIDLYLLQQRILGFQDL